jgi:hypothetical protein
LQSVAAVKATSRSERNASCWRCAQTRYFFLRVSSSVEAKPTPKIDIVAGSGTAKVSLAKAGKDTIVSKKTEVMKRMDFSLLTRVAASCFVDRSASMSRRPRSPHSRAMREIQTESRGSWLSARKGRSQSIGNPSHAPLMTLQDSTTVEDGAAKDMPLEGQNCDFFPPINQTLADDAGFIPVEL